MDGFTDQLADTKKTYRAYWQPVDADLYELCLRRRPGQRDFADVYSKVAIIGRIYATGLPRTVLGDPNPEASVARGLIDQAELLETRLQELKGRQLDRDSIGQIIDLNARIGRGLLAQTGGKWQQSFVSKYLHFHCDQIPILDSQAEGSIGRFVNWPAVYKLRKVLGKPEDWCTRYYNYATALLYLYEQAAQTSAAPTVKEVDYLLWQPA